MVKSGCDPNQTFLGPGFDDIPITLGNLIRSLPDRFSVNIRDSRGFFQDKRVCIFITVMILYSKINSSLIIAK